jgi:hypothetical protein
VTTKKGDDLCGVSVNGDRVAGARDFDLVGHCSSLLLRVDLVRVQPVAAPSPAAVSG